MTEIWDLVDENGNKVGISWSRDERDRIPLGLYLPCVEVWVKVGDELLITRRHPNKREGLKYDCPGGAAVSGEKMEDAAVRELYEEVGIVSNIEHLCPLGSVILDNVYARSYLLTLDSLPQLHLQTSEVVGYKLVSQNELSDMTNMLTVGTYRRFLEYQSKIFG